MPLARVRYDPGAFNDEWLMLFGVSLCGIVAFVLTCDDEGGQLTGDDVEVLFEKAHCCDVSNLELFADVEAMYFPSRGANFEERKAQLEQAIQRIVPEGLRAGGWIKLVNAVWVEFEGQANRHS